LIPQQNHIAALPATYPFKKSFFSTGFPLSKKNHLSAIVGVFLILICLTTGFDSWISSPSFLLLEDKSVVDGY